MYAFLRFSPRTHQFSFKSLARLVKPSLFLLGLSDNICHLLFHLKRFKTSTKCKSHTTRERDSYEARPWKNRTLVKKSGQLTHCARESASAKSIGGFEYRCTQIVFLFLLLCRPFVTGRSKPPWSNWTEDMKSRSNGVDEWRKLLFAGRIDRL